MRALVIRQEPLDKVLSGKKTWEIRGSRTLIREAVGLIESGSGRIVGVCEVKDCVGPLTLAELRRNARRAGVNPDGGKLPYKRTHAWVLANARRFKKAVSYEHPPGAVIWVQLDEKTARAVQRAR
ncbi:MAG TPA: ASCH domain-containing protein [Bryobacteraceae bacterium]|nr:ASCH domain-containing protein [Bryobacteraceae bacterium]